MTIGKLVVVGATDPVSATDVVAKLAAIGVDPPVDAVVEFGGTIRCG